MGHKHGAYRLYHAARRAALRLRTRRRCGAGAAPPAATLRLAPPCARFGSLPVQTPPLRTRRALLAALGEPSAAVGGAAMADARGEGYADEAAAVIYAPASAAAQLCRCSKRPRPIFRSRSRRPMAAGPPPRSDVTGDRHAGASGHGYC